MNAGPTISFSPDELRHMSEWERSARVITAYEAEAPVLASQKAYAARFVPGLHEDEAAMAQQMGQGVQGLFAPGAEVRIQGLTHPDAARLNGQAGMILQETEDGRFEVELTLAAGTFQRGIQRAVYTPQEAEAGDPTRQAPALGPYRTGNPLTDVVDLFTGPWIPADYRPPVYGRSPGARPAAMVSRSSKENPEMFRNGPGVGLAWWGNQWVPYEVGGAAEAPEAGGNDDLTAFRNYSTVKIVLRKGNLQLVAPGELTGR
mmetsp:Transcript_70170/g.161083  ORF Transcript_70170/g.161083 Transcript_70170/m.161083 type:complete len:260 (-) Transcript_70170:9-788(-)